MISVNNVCMEYPLQRRFRDYLLHPFSPQPKFRALEDVNLAIEKGDRIAFLGPNGAGKTTLLKIIGGLLLPSKGTVFVNEHDTNTDNAGVRKSVGFVLNEERSFFWRLTALQNLEFFGALDNLRGQQLHDRIDALVDLTGIREFAAKPVSNYSSGVKQRLAMARGLMADPAVLILDEPTRALDPIACEELIKLILEQIHKRTETTLLIATHRIEDALQLCNKALVINRGRIVSQIHLAELARQGVELRNHYRDCVQRTETAHVDP
jgi:ABC-2 type transport system ATP-binding protein